MKSTEIKKILKEKFNLPARVNKTGGKNPYITANLGYNNPVKFPLDLRQKCLRVIYGEDCKFAEGGSAGNVAPHMVSMHEHEWVKVFGE
jgi:hypothetical protein